MHPNVHGSTLYNSQNMEAAWMSSDRWMNKQDVICIHNGILLNHKKEWNNSNCNNMDVCTGYHTMWRQKKKNITWYHLHAESQKMTQMSLFTSRNRLTAKTNVWLLKWKAGGSLGLTYTHY